VSTVGTHAPPPAPHARRNLDPFADKVLVTVIMFGPPRRGVTDSVEALVA
jgi:hypothetical protein